MNKKGFWFNMGVAVVVFFILFYAYNAINDKYYNVGKQIGVRQVSVMEAYREGENVMQYIDRAAKTAALSLYDKSKNGLDNVEYKKKFIALLDEYSLYGTKILHGIDFFIEVELEGNLVVIKGVGDRMIKIPTNCQDELISAPDFYYDFLPSHYGDRFTKACGVYAIKPVFRVEIDKAIWEG